MDSPEPVSLSFDKAKFDENSSPSLSCALCKRDVFGTYYEINGQTACEQCRFRVESSRIEGSPLGRALRALVGGGIGGIVGAGIYYAVSALTGYEIGLVAVVVGLLVGFGVRWGSGGVGGRGYQVLAVAITYMAIVSTYVPTIIEEIRKQPEAAETATVESEVEVTPGTVAVALLAVMLLAVVAPFFAGIQSVMWLLIIGIALHQAWRVNGHTPLQIEGPFQIGATPKETSA
jgi:hypothetical protein